MKSLRYLALVGVIITATATGQEYDYERCASIGRSTKEFKEYMWCLDRLDARDSGKKYWRTPTPNDPTYKKFTAEEVVAERRTKERAEAPIRYASQVSAARESYEKSLIAFAALVNNGGAGHWSSEIRVNTWSFGGIMVNNYEKWEQAVIEERDFRESAGLDNSQYEGNIRNLEKAKQVYSALMEKARDQAESAGYDAP